jgi:hypothetical protein
MNERVNLVNTIFVTTEVPLQSSPLALRRDIESNLAAQGEPLRWAITEIQPEHQRVVVEAVLLTGCDVDMLSHPLL